MTWLGYIGDIQGMTVHDSGISFDWKIPKFFSVHGMPGDYFTNALVTFLGAEFYFRIYPFGMNEFPEWIWLELHSNDDDLTFHFSLSMKNADGREVKLLPNLRYPENWIIKFIHRCKLLHPKSELSLPVEDSLVICCTLWQEEQSSVQRKEFVVSETQTDDNECGATGNLHERFDSRGGAILLKNFKDLLLKGEDHDVNLIVRDQVFKAHKNILRARSPVFWAMFAHNTKEAESGDVIIDDCDPETFGKFLEYVYIGRIESITHTIALGLYYAADKYDLQDLKETCGEFLKTCLSTTTICDVITLAMDHDEDKLLDCAMTFFSSHLMEVLMTVEWQRFLTPNPIKANELLIKAMKLQKGAERKNAVN